MTKTRRIARSVRDIQNFRRVFVNKLPVRRIAAWLVLYFGEEEVRGRLTQAQIKSRRKKRRRRLP